MSIVHLTEKEVAARLQVTPRTMRRWRDEGGGPRCMGLGSDGRTIRYRIADIDDFERGKLTPAELPPAAAQAMSRAAQVFDVILRWDMKPEQRDLLTGMRDDLRALIAKPKSEA